MKYLKYPLLVITAICMFIAGACKKSLIETPYSSLSPADVFKDESGLQKATLGIYQIFTTTWPTAWFRFGLAETGQQYSTAGMYGDYFNTLNRFTTTPSSDAAGQMDAVWTQNYAAISRANTVIENAPLAVPDAAVANKYIAEARLLRAFSYFDLVRNFGEVPLIDKAITSLNQSELIFAKRAALQQVYDFIVADLTFAETNLPEKWTSGDLGRASAGTAKALLGKVYLTMAGKPLNNTAAYQKAVDKLKEVTGTNESKYNFGLLPNFTDVFSNNNKRNPEIVLVFTTFFSSIRTDPSIYPFFLFPRGLTGGSEQTNFGLTHKFYQLFESTDTRRDFTCVVKYKTVETGDGAVAGDSVYYDPVKLRYIDAANRNIVGQATTNVGYAFAKMDRSVRPAGSGPWGYPIDMVQLRYSDVLLCLAEAYVETGNNQEALTIINRIRTRAKTTPYADLANMRERVRLERKLELMGEFTTVYDIRRWGTLQSEIASMVPQQVLGGIVGTYNAKFELYPIPQTQIDRNPNLTQNPGY